MELWKLKHLVEINCHFSIEYLVKVRGKKWIVVKIQWTFIAGLWRDANCNRVCSASIHHSTSASLITSCSGTEQRRCMYVLRRGHMAETDWWSPLTDVSTAGCDDGEDKVWALLNQPNKSHPFSRVFVQIFTQILPHGTEQWKVVNRHPAASQVDHYFNDVGI